MNTRSTIFSALFTTLLFATAGPTIAAKGGGSSGSAIRVESLPMPAGANQSMAGDINEHGTAIVGSIDWTGDAYWYFAARWTRASAATPWQAEDLRPLLPPSKSSSASLVNNAGTVVAGSEFQDGTNHVFVIMSAGATIELAPGDEPVALSETDALAGIRWGGSVPNKKPIYWSAPGAAAEELPVLEAGSGGEARWFLGEDVLGTLQDSNGSWLVRWTRTDGQWNVTRVVQLPSHYAVGDINSAGRLALRICAPLPCQPYGTGVDNGAIWDPPYDAAPTYLVRPGGRVSGAGQVLENGSVLGGLTSSSGGVPVIWPTPETFMEFPLLPHTDDGFPGRGNEFKQVVGHVRLYSARQYKHVAVLWTLP